jgi:hypothetical protein
MHRLILYLVIYQLPFYQIDAAIITYKYLLVKLILLDRIKYLITPSICWPCANAAFLGEIGPPWGPKLDGLPACQSRQTTTFKIRIVWLFGNVPSKQGLEEGCQQRLQVLKRQGQAIRQSTKEQVLKRQGRVASSYPKSESTSPWRGASS